MVKSLPANAGDMRLKFDTLVRKIPLKEGMTTHSSILAWRIPWTEEPGWLQSTGHKQLDRTEVTYHIHARNMF